MLRRFSALQGCEIKSSDVPLGRLLDCYFDERSWQIRYFVLGLNESDGRPRLIPPNAVNRINIDAGTITLSLTRDAIASSPQMDDVTTISRTKEQTLHDHYHWTPYWQGYSSPSTFAAFPPEITALWRWPFSRGETAVEVESEQQTTDTNLRSSAELRGYSIGARDGNIGNITDFIIDDQDWLIRELLVDTGSWLPGQKILLAPPWIKAIQWAKREITVALDQKSVRAAPPFDPELLNSSDYERDLLRHFEDWFNFLIAREKEKNMLLGKNIMGNDIISVDDGERVGRIQDLYLTKDCRQIAGIYLGSSGLFSRETRLIPREAIVTIGKDAILVKNSDVVASGNDTPESENWLRRDELQGREVDTSGGTRVGKIGDVVLNRDGEVVGFSLSSVFVSGPIAERSAIALHTIDDLGHEDGAMTINLEEAEQQQLHVS